MTIGAAKPAVEVATAYTARRKAFGATISTFQGVSFQIAEAVLLLDGDVLMTSLDCGVAGCTD